MKSMFLEDQGEGDRRCDQEIGVEVSRPEKPIR